MSDIKEQEVFVNRIIRQLMNEQLHERNTVEQDNKGVVFLESGTMNMMLLYMLMKENGSSDANLNMGFTEVSERNIINNIEQVIEDNKREFEEVMALLKEKF